MDDLEAAWDTVHKALPAGWTVGRTRIDDPRPGVWSVTAVGPIPDRGKRSVWVTGKGPDEVAALRDLDARLRDGPKADRMWVHELRDWLGFALNIPVVVLVSAVWVLLLLWFLDWSSSVGRKVLKVLGPDLLAGLAGAALAAFAGWWIWRLATGRVDQPMTSFERIRGIVLLAVIGAFGALLLVSRLLQARS